MQRSLGIIVIAVAFCLLGIFVCGKSLLLLTAQEILIGGEFFWLDRVGPCVFGAVLVFTGWGLFRLYNWARFTAMLVLFVGAGAELPLLVRAASHFHWSLVWGTLECLLRLIVVGYLFRSSTAEKFLKSAKAA